MDLKSEKNLLFRILTAGLAIALVLGMLYYSWNTFWLLCLILSLAGIWEFLRLLKLDHQKTVFIPAILPVLGVWIYFFTQPHPDKMLDAILSGIIISLLMSMLLVLLDAKIENAFHSLALLVFSTVYVFVPFALFIESLMMLPEIIIFTSPLA